MKQTLTIASLLLVASCTQKEDLPKGKLANTLNDTSAFVHRDTANRQIKSYLDSIGYPGNDSTIRSWSMDATQLRAYLADTNIKSVKIVIGQTPSNTTANFQGGTNLNVFICGYNLAGNYIYQAGNNVIGGAVYCPPVCPPGQAANPLFTAGN